MRNLKRVLSLALALVMVLGMMVITTSAADFTDADEITYEEAIDVMAGLGLFKGDNGALKPQEILTREEAATLMARIMLGEKTADKLVATKQIFADVPADDWAAKYIEYCYNTGLIGGYTVNGELVFNPEGNLTGVAFAKLLLCAMGYNADAQGYGGSNWASAIAVDALEAGLTIDGVVISADLTREQAAQMILQALEGSMVKYTNAFDYATGAAVVIGPNPTGVTFMAKYFPNLLKTDGTDDMWGRPAEYAWELKDGTVLYTKWEEAAAKYNTAVSDCQIALDMKLKADATKFSYVNGVLGTTFIDLDRTVADNGAQGAQIEVYKDRIIRIDTYLAKVDTVVTELKDAGGHTIRNAKNDISVYGLVDADAYVKGNTYAKGDMILVNYNVAKDTYVALGAAEAFVGAQTFIWWAANKHTVAGVEYMDACQMVLDDAQIDLVAKYTWYLDQFGNVIGAAKINTPKTYGIVEGVQWINTWGINGYAQANIRYMDGTSGTAIIKEVGVNPTTYADYTALNFDGTVNDFAAGKISTVWQYNDDCMKDLYQIIQNTDGTVSLIAQTELTAATVADGISVVTGTGTPNYIFTDNYTVYLIQSQNPVTKAYTYSMVTGYDNLEAKWTGTATVDYVNYTPDNGYAKYVYITGATDAAAAKGASEFVYFTSNTRYYGDAMQNNVPCFVIGGLVRADGNTDVLYVAKDAAGTEAQTMVALSSFLAGAQDKLYVVKTADGVAKALTDMTMVTTGSDDNAIKASTYAFFANKGTFTTIDGNGVLKVVNGTTTTAYNVNASTTIINKGGVGTVTDLNNAVLTGKSIYVVAKYVYDFAGNKIPTTQVAAIFITDIDNTPVVVPPSTVVVAEGTAAVKGDVLYVDKTATGLEQAKAVEAALIAAGYTDIEVTLDNGVFKGATAKDGSIAVTFQVAAPSVAITSSESYVKFAHPTSKRVTVGMNFTIDQDVAAGEMTWVVYSGETALAEATYVKDLVAGTYERSFDLYHDDHDSSSWDGNNFVPSAELKPTCAKMYINGVLVNEVAADISDAQWTAYINSL